jgi:hypothetical protein
LKSVIAMPLPTGCGDAQLPRTKTLEEFEFARVPKIAAARIRELAEGEYIDRSEPVVLIGKCVTGRSSAGGCAGAGGAAIRNTAVRA